ncbi:efflux RND transporter permease subunit, partial [Sulfuricurvum sp. RIFCSPLOWO2_12_FULL_43_24]
MKDFNLSEWAVTHRPMVLFLIIAVLIAGIVSFTKLGRSEDPNFNVPTMSIVVAWPGATAKEVQNQVLNRIERKLQELEYIDYVKSYSRQGFGAIEVRFKGGIGRKNLDESWYQARKKISDISREFPSGVRGPFFNDEYNDVYSVLYAVKA